MAPPDGQTPAGDEVTRLEALLKREPRSPEFYRLADAYTRAGRYLDAASICRQGLRFHPRLGEGYVALGRALFGAGHLPRAVQVLRKCLSLDHPSSEPYRLLGEVLLWQDAPGEAVKVLEEAVARGHAVPTIENLLERARAALDAQKTDVVGVPERRGIGNLAVAGTIGDDELQGRAVAARRAARREPGLFAKTPRVELPQADRLKTLSRAALEGTPNERAGEGKWNALEDLWSRELDAHSQPFPDLDSDPGPFAPTARLEVPLAPLVDPLSEGIPPLPQESEDSGVSVLPLSAGQPQLDGEASMPTTRLPRLTPPGPTAALSPPPLAEAASTDELSAPGADLARIRLTQIPPAPPRKAPPQIVAPAVVADPGSGEPPPEQGHEGRLPPEMDESPAHDAALAARVTVAVRHRSPRRPATAGEDDPDLRLLEALALPERSPTGLSPTPVAAATARQGPMAPAARRRRGGVGFWVMICLLCAGAGAGGVFLYLQFFSSDPEKQALAQAARARQLDHPGEYAAASAALLEIAKKGDASGTIVAEAELMSGLAWLQYRAGSPPPPGNVFKTWPQALAQAAVALADNDPRRALPLLEGTPRDRANQGLRLFLLAWAKWLQGLSSEAEQHLKEARGFAPELTSLDVLEGLWRREAGEPAAAEERFRRALARSPGHEVAAAGLAAVLVARDPASVELDKLLASSPATPVGKAWHRLIAAERQFRIGQRVPLAELPVQLAAAPPSPALLFYGLEVLARTGRFLEAGAELARLKKIRNDASLPVQLLESELEIAQGLELKALERLRRLDGPAAVRLRAWAAALAGRGTEVGELLGAERGEAVQPLRLLSEALKDPKRPSDALRRLSRRSPEAKLALLLLFLARGQRDEAMRTAQQLEECPWLRLRARVAQAELLLQRRRTESALDLLRGVAESSLAYPPALELLGRLDLELGNPERALSELRSAWRAGRRSPHLAEALVKALALTGEADAAAGALDRARRDGGLPPQRVSVLESYLEVARGKAVAPIGPAAGELPLLMALADLQLRRGKPVEAEKLFRQGQKLSPGHPLPCLKLGLLLAGRRKAEALVQLDRAIERVRRNKRYPSSILVEALLGKARYQLARREPSAAIAPALAAVEAGGQAAAAYRVLAEALLASRRHREAREALDKLIALDPSDADALFLLGTAARAERARAHDALRRFLELEPKGRRAAVARRLLSRGR